MQTKVIFSAVKKRPDRPNSPPYHVTCNDCDLTYDKLEINLGNGFNIRNGIFTVPISGTYRFNFSGQSGQDPGLMIGEIGVTSNSYIYVKKNGETNFYIWTSNSDDPGVNMSYTWVMNLTKNDRVNLYTYNQLYVDSEYPVIFTGELIHV